LRIAGDGRPYIPTTIGNPQPDTVSVNVALVQAVRGKVLTVVPFCRHSQGMPFAGHLSW